MAKNSIPDYSATAASNTDIQSVNIDEGCAPSGINNAIRELMVDLKNMDTGTVALTSPQMTSVDINGGTVDGVTLGTNSAVTEAQVDNININGNTVSSTNTNGDVNLSPNGTGTVVINTDLDVDNININGNTIISTDTNGNIALTPNGTGEVDISKVDIDSGAIDGTTIGASSAAAITGTTITATGDVDIADKIVHTGDTNTSVRFPAADTVSVETGGTERMRIDSSGNVGIGTTSPVVPLQIKASSPAVSLQASASKTSGSRADFNVYNSNVSTVGYIRFGAVTDNVGTDMQFAVRPAAGSLTEAMRIDSSGNLLLGGTVVGNGGKVAVTGTVSISNSTTNLQSSMSKEGMQQTSGITTATTIFTSVTQGMSSASAAQLIIHGNDNAGNGFLDVVVTTQSGTPVTVSSTTTIGSPAARTYTMSTAALQLAMASGTYSTNVKCTTMGYPF